MENKQSNQEIWFNTIVKIIIFSGIILSVSQLLFNRNLWRDEAMLALNIVSKSYLGLLQPLDRAQVAPIGFLFIEKIFATIFGYTDYSMRIFPFISFCLAIFFFYLLAERLFKSKPTALLAAAYLSMNEYLLYYSTEIKQYSLDVLVCILILLSTIRFNPKSTGSVILYSVTGAVLVWFSNIAIIVLFVCGLYSFYKIFILKKDWVIFLPVISWLISFGIYYFLFINNHPTTEYMKDYWGERFLTLNIFSKEFYIFLYSSMENMYRMIFIRSKYYWLLPATFSLAGMVFLFRQKRNEILFLLIIPTIVHLFLSGLKLYPFDTRFLLYLIPLLILIYVYGQYYSWELIKRKFPKLPLFILTIPLILMYYPVVKKFPEEKEEVEQALSFIEGNIVKNDNIYVSVGAVPAFIFYQDEYKSINDTENIVYSDDWEWIEFTNDILKTTGSSWLIFTRYSTNGSREKSIISRLTEHNYKILIEKRYTGYSVIKIESEHYKN